MPQIELAVGSEVTALVLRVLEPINADDEALLRAFADEHKVQFWLQPKGPDTVTPFYPLDVSLDYTLPEFGIRMPFADRFHAGQPSDQPRAGGPRAAPAPSRDDRVLDLFCGIGNFTLPLARLSREVMGIEGSDTLTTRALANARENGVDGHTTFACRNLFEVTGDDMRALGAFDKFLIDPPREGALAVSKALPRSRRAAKVRCRSASCTCRATRRRWRATRACSCTRPATA